MQCGYFLQFVYIIISMLIISSDSDFALDLEKFDIGRKRLWDCLVQVEEEEEEKEEEGEIKEKKYLELSLALSKSILELNPSCSTVEIKCGFWMWMV